MSGVAMAAGGGGEKSAAFQRLREELSLHPGPEHRDGSPSWTIYDPARSRFFRIGWMEFEILARWKMGDPSAIAQAINQDTTLRVTPGHVENFVRFMASANLLVSNGEEGISRLEKQVAAGKMGKAKWLLKNYLFFKIHLIRPDRMLESLKPASNLVYSSWFLILTLMAGALGGFLSARQWDVFTNSFLHFFSVEGVILAFLSLVIAKALHEMGHGMTASRFGCRVPSMGIAFMVLYPMPYTDTSEVWKLTSRRQRLSVAIAGIVAELGLACWALLAWNILPDGPLRSMFFTWATTTWILTLIVNLTPFMRFDGYFILTELLDVPNLQDRAFSLTRWKIRETLFGFGNPHPEKWTPGMQRTLILWSVTTWIYRFFLFLGIALLVYHMAFKVLGIILFVVEIWWFIWRPIQNEIIEWFRKRKEFRVNMNLIRTLLVTSALVTALVYPWRSTVEAPGLVGAESYAPLFARASGQVVEINADVGSAAAEGSVLIRLSSPDVEHQLAQVNRRIASLEWQVSALGSDRELVARSQVLARELQAARTEKSSLEAERARLEVPAPFDGKVVSMSEPLRIGDWVRQGESLGEFADMNSTRVEAYVSEADLGRISLDTRASFVPENPSLPRIPLRLSLIDNVATKNLTDPELSDRNGGEISTRPQQNGTLIPELPVYRVRLVPKNPIQPVQMQRGIVLIEGNPESIISRIYRQIIGIMIRESGF